MLFKRSRSERKNENEPTIIRYTVNERLRRFDAQLATTLGMMIVIRMLRRREAVYKLLLGNNSFGDAECIHLFEFLNSPLGLRCRDTLITIRLTKNEIGVEGLRSVSTFLKGNQVLRELCLSENPLTNDPDIIAEFVSALNSSHLYALQIHDCGPLGDEFIQFFIPRLSTSYLRKLDISGLELTRDIVPTLVDYVKSPHCLLDFFQCNKNMLTLLGSRKIIEAIEGNSCLRTLRLNDKIMPDPDFPIEEDAMTAFLDGHHIMWDFLQRNKDRVERVVNDSLILLRYCRTLFMCSGSTRMKKAVPTFDPKALSRRNNKSILLSRLPIELQLEIFSYIAPSVSSEQYARVIAFAADVTTLFLVGPKFDGVRALTKHIEFLVEEKFQSPIRRHRPRPTDMWVPRQWWECTCDDGTTNSDADEGISLYQSICCSLQKWKTEMRHMWLTQVVGDAYGHEP